MPLKQPFHLPWPPSVGDRVPDWVMPSSLGHDLDAGKFAGRPLVACFVTTRDPGTLASILGGFRDAHGEFQQLGATVLAVTVAPAEWATRLTEQLALPFPVLADTDGSVAQAHRVVSHVLKTFVADSNLRVLRVYEGFDPPSHAREVLEFVRGVTAREEPRHLTGQAPVLLIPNVFSPEWCRRLIRVWETEGNEESGFMVQRGGQTVGVYDASHKIRRDHYLQEGETKRLVNYHVCHRVRPEIRKAFHFDITRMEDFRIVCYDARTGGYFRPHRDNTTDDTAHRVWAMTVNLNAGEYEGGYLRFPEYGPHLYLPQTGEVAIFSCSLLHEATDVTAGRRFVLLSFFYGEREARLREEIARWVGDDYRASGGQR